MMRSIHLFAFGLLLAGSLFVRAQVSTPAPRLPLGATPPPKSEPYVQVFFEEQCRGRSVRLKVPCEMANNEQLEAVGIPGDSIMSLRIPNGVSVTIYANDRFGGRHEIFTGRVGTLGDLRRAASSLKVEVTSEKK